VAQPTKQQLKQELALALTEELETVERAHKATQAAATHEEAKPENDKDTRALEQSYLARGQALRATELRAAVADVTAMPLRAFGEDAPAALGALVEASEDEERRLFFIAPHGGGTRLANGTVQVVTPEAPLGRALIGKRVGDECEVKLAGKTRTLGIERID